MSGAVLSARAEPDHRNPVSRSHRVMDAGQDAHAQLRLTLASLGRSTLPTNGATVGIAPPQVLVHSTQIHLPSSSADPYSSNTYPLSQLPPPPAGFGQQLVRQLALQPAQQPAQQPALQPAQQPALQRDWLQLRPVLRQAWQQREQARQQQQVLDWLNKLVAKVITKEERGLRDAAQRELKRLAREADAVSGWLNRLITKVVTKEERERTKADKRLRYLEEQAVAVCRSRGIEPPDSSRWLALLPQPANECRDMVVRAESPPQHPPHLQMSRREGKRVGKRKGTPNELPASLAGRRVTVWLSEPGETTAHPGSTHGTIVELAPDGSARIRLGCPCSGIDALSGGQAGSSAAIPIAPRPACSFLFWWPAVDWAWGEHCRRPSVRAREKAEWEAFEAEDPKPSGPSADARPAVL